LTSLSLQAWALFLPSKTCFTAIFAAAAHAQRAVDYHLHGKQGHRAAA
jgi:antirestriction protein ArdC